MTAPNESNKSMSVNNSSLEVTLGMAVTDYEKKKGKRKQGEGACYLVYYHQGAWQSILLGIRVRKGLGPSPSWPLWQIWYGIISRNSGSKSSEEFDVGLATGLPGLFLCAICHSSLFLGRECPFKRVTRRNLSWGDDRATTWRDGRILNSLGVR